MNWKELKDKNDLRTRDLVIVKYKDSKYPELGFVDSGFTDGTPSRISSIPESWSHDLEYITKTGMMKQYKGKIVGNILYYSRPDIPVKINCIECDQFEGVCEICNGTGLAALGIDRSFEF